MAPRHIVQWECWVETDSTDQALEAAQDAMTAIRTRPDLQCFTVRRHGAQGRIVDRRPILAPHSIPITTILNVTQEGD